MIKEYNQLIHAKLLNLEDLQVKDSDPNIETQCLYVMKLVKSIARFNKDYKNEKLQRLINRTVLL